MVELDIVCQSGRALLIGAKMITRAVMTQHELALKGHKGSYLIGYRLGFNALNPPLNYQEVFVK